MKKKNPRSIYRPDRTRPDEPPPEPRFQTDPDRVPKGSDEYLNKAADWPPGTGTIKRERGKS